MVDVDTTAPSGAGSTDTSPAGAKSTTGSATGSATAGSGPRRSTVVLGVLLAVLLVAGAVLFVRDRTAQGEPAQRQAALAQARAVATQFAGLGGENAQTTLQALIDGSTGPFHEQLTRGAGSFAAALQNARVISSGKVAAAGLESFEPRAATALVVLSGTLANVDVPQGQPVSYRLSFQMREEHGQWLVSAVEVLP